MGRGSRILTLATSTSAVASDPRAPRREILVRASTGCHRAESFPAYRFTQNEYQSIVCRMAQHGAQASSTTAIRLELIAEYLASNVPTIEDPAKANVNQAAANEIEAATRLPRARLKRWSRAANAT